ncbi:MAG TPA: hypothetical protein PLD62_08250, partial [Candidatus Cloacimonadota bacterium]|nr:hypothetical protein [Candidatus Cloacimonadota bacterium]
MKFRFLFIFLLITASWELFSLSQTGPNGIDLWLLSSDHETGAIYASSNKGNLYKFANNEWIELTTPESGEEVFSIDVHNNTIFLCSYEHIIKSTDGGETW